MEGPTAISESRPPTPLTPPVSDDSGIESNTPSVANEEQQTKAIVEEDFHSVSDVLATGERLAQPVDFTEPELEESVLFDSTSSCIHSDSTKDALSERDIEILKEKPFYSNHRVKRTIAEICFSSEYTSPRVQYVDRDDEDDLGDGVHDGKKRKSKAGRTSIGKVHSEESKASETVCKWGECSQKQTTFNELYDHLMEVHLKPFTCEENHDIIAMCEWEGCQMAIERGDWEYRYKWMEQHVRSRHTKNVESHKCMMDGCRSRFTTKGKLEEHVRVEHINGNKKKKVQPVEMSTTEHGFGWVDKMDPSHNEEEETVKYSRYLSAELAKKLKEAGGNQVKLVPKTRKGVGSGRRKRYARPEWEIVVCKKNGKLEESSDKDKMSKMSDVVSNQQDSFEHMDIDVVDEYEGVTMDDLFPGYNFEASRNINSKTDLSAKLQSKAELDVIDID